MTIYGNGSSTSFAEMVEKPKETLLKQEPVRDVFRYLALLMEGGIYTDTDTACIRPIIRWPGIRESHWDLKDITDSLLTSLPHMEDLLMQAEQEGDKYTVLPGGAKPMEVKVTPSEAICDRMAKLKLDAWDPPRLVVGVEFDDWGPSAKEHWSKGSLARGMQIVQPGHPVFVDVLGRIMKDIQNGRGTYADDLVDESGKKKVLSAERLMDILDFTGPGVL
ncbi:hypothetical protein QFC21_002189 [Naganishia friedmannii]|uniref:Uncharacterized protein n=1 Tax=Naganishia friedmannii TaxID=89922 RepID=A0ACC2VXC9_9TREE|nr:hypothetical protein QFC21_002189 [Naganishia friedmannii]